MRIHLLKSKIHRAKITGASLHYEGSLGIDLDYIERVGLRPYERILCANLATGARFETYVIPDPRGARTFTLNGAASRLGAPGDLLTIMAFGEFDAETADSHTPRMLVLDDENEIHRERLDRPLED